MAEVGKRFGISRERVRQIQRNAVSTAFESHEGHKFFADGSNIEEIPDTGGLTIHSAHRKVREITVRICNSGL